MSTSLENALTVSGNTIMRHVLNALSGLCLGLVQAPAHAQNGPPNIENGRTLTQRLCITCHASTADSASGGRPDVPSFSAIARTPNITPERLAGAILLPHPAMPGVPLTRAELRDIIAYIMSLKVDP